MSKLLSKLVAIAFGCTAGLHFGVQAAETCVLKNASGQQEESAKKNPRDCTSDASLNKIQESINTTGSKLLTQALLTNAEKLAVAAGAEGAEGATAQQPAKPLPVWHIRRTDGTLRASLERWLREQNATLPAKEERWVLVWDVPRKFPADVDTSFTGTLESAIDQLMESLRISDYPLTACVYDNRVVRIVRNGDMRKCDNAY